MTSKPNRTRDPHSLLCPNSRQYPLARGTYYYRSYRQLRVTLNRAMKRLSR